MKKSEIRIANINDVERISEIGIEAFSKAFINVNNKNEVLFFLDKTYNLVQLKIDIESGKRYYLCENKGKVVGFILLSEESPYDSEESYLKIERLYLDPIEIGNGYGHELMIFANELALESEIKVLWLEVLRTNEKAINFYNKLGFQAFDQAPAKFKSDNEIDIWMKKEIN